MRIGIISDVHANLEALEAALAFVEKNSDITVSLGDAVGYGPDPEKCEELISEKCEVKVRGNHEECLIRNDFSRMKETARTALEWTREKLSCPSMERIKAWTEKDSRESAVFVHASLSDHLYKYILSTRDAEPEFSLLDYPVCFVGHTHMPGGFVRDMSSGKTGVIMPDFSGRIRLKIEDSHRYIINAGSVGQPRDGLPLACASVYDTEKKSISLHRIEYPLEKTRKKIIERGLPSVLARRIMQAV